MTISVQQENSPSEKSEIANDVEIAQSTVLRILDKSGFRPPVRTCELEECFKVLRGKQKKFCSVDHNAKQRTKRNRLVGSKPNSKMSSGRFKTRIDLEKYIRANSSRPITNKELAEDCCVSYNAVVYILYIKEWNQPTK